MAENNILPHTHTPLPYASDCLCYACKQQQNYSISARHMHFEFLILIGVFNCQGWL